MPTTRKQKKARKSRGLEMLSDIENLDIMLGENHSSRVERDGSLDSTSVRRHESIMSNIFNVAEENLYSDHRNSNVRSSANYGHNSADMNSQAEINRLSSELNSRISGEIDEMMSIVSSQIQRGINEAINAQVLPQIQIVIMAGSGRETRRGWETSVERPAINSEVQHNSNVKNNLRNEQNDDHRIGDYNNRNVHDRMYVNKANGSLFYIFRHYATFFERKKIFKNFKFFFQKIVLRFLSLRYGADFRRSRLVLI